MRQFLAAAILLIGVEALSAAEPRWTLALTLDNQRLEATPITWTNSRAFMLARWTTVRLRGVGGQRRQEGVADVSGVFRR